MPFTSVGVDVGVVAAASPPLPLVGVDTGVAAAAFLTFRLIGIVAAEAGVFSIPPFTCVAACARFGSGAIFPNSWAVISCVGSL